jgi:hypothetical protein
VADGPECGYCAAPLRWNGRSLSFCDPPNGTAEDATCQAKWAKDRLADQRLWMFPYEEFTGYVPSDAFGVAQETARKRFAGRR